MFEVMTTVDKRPPDAIIELVLTSSDVERTLFYTATDTTMAAELNNEPVDVVLAYGTTYKIVIPAKKNNLSIMFHGVATDKTTFSISTSVTAGNGTLDRTIIKEVKSWDSKVRFNYMRFTGCNELISVPDTPPNILSASSLFSNCLKFNSPNVSKWKKLPFKTMVGTFSGCVEFNQSLNGWDVSDITSTAQCFKGCTIFNQPLSNWRPAKVTTMGGMFEECHSFYQDISGWTTTSCKNMNRMFYNCMVFSSPLDNWDVSNVTTMYAMFFGCTGFTGAITNWKTDSLTNCGWMFANCTYFNRPVNHLNITKVTDLSYMFYKCVNFNQLVANMTATSTGECTNMSYMFAHCTLFNKSFAPQKTDKVTNIDYMLYNCSAYNNSMAATNFMSTVTRVGYDTGCTSWTSSRPNFTKTP